MTSAINEESLLEGLNIKIPVKDQIKKELKNEDILGFLNIDVADDNEDTKEIQDVNARELVEDNVLEDLDIELQIEDDEIEEKIDNELKIIEEEDILKDLNLTMMFPKEEPQKEESIIVSANENIEQNNVNKASEYIEEIPKEPLNEAKKSNEIDKLLKDPKLIKFIQENSYHPVPTGGLNQGYVDDNFYTRNQVDIYIEAINEDIT